MEKTIQSLDQMNNTVKQGEGRKMKPFRITVETLDEKYINGGASKMVVYECEGYMLSAFLSDNRSANLAQGAIDVEGIAKIIVKMGPKAVDEARRIFDRCPKGNDREAIMDKGLNDFFDTLSSILERSTTRG